MPWFLGRLFNCVRAVGVVWLEKLPPLFGVLGCCVVLRECVGWQRWCVCVFVCVCVIGAADVAVRLKLETMQRCVAVCVCVCVCIAN